MAGAERGSKGPQDSRTNVHEIVWAENSGDGVGALHDAGDSLILPFPAATATPWPGMPVAADRRIDDVRAAGAFGRAASLRRPGSVGWQDGVAGHPLLHVTAVTPGLGVLPIVDDIHAQGDLHVDDVLHRLGQSLAVGRTRGSVQIFAAIDQRIYGVWPRQIAGVGHQNTLCAMPQNASPLRSHATL